MFQFSYINFNDTKIQDYIKVLIFLKAFGGNRTRTDNFILAKHTLYHLSYTPFPNKIIIDLL